jgi:hypothetical protein
VYDLIQGHGRTDMCLFYATTIGDYERVIEHWILEEEWVKAIDIISRQVCFYILCADIMRLTLGMPVV